ncbi:MAG: DUF1579 domain-containing protein [Desulfobacteraceae bacterium]|nr:MAG: DUF1579 domain-containing protein [Desulfobacteraceae bacterium]
METDKNQPPSMMATEPQDEHKWLHKLVGEWTYEGAAVMAPGQAPAQFKGVESVRSLGGLWIVAEAKGEMPGCGEASMMMTLGFDTQKKRFVGTWIGSMMTYLWKYDGELDEAGKVLTLNSEGPAMAVEGKMAQYRDVIELASDDRRVLSSLRLDDDGKWHRFMAANYRRKE